MKVVIFHSYVKKPQGYSTWFPWKCNNPTSISSNFRGRMSMTQTLLLKLLPFPSRPQDVERIWIFHPTWNLEIPWVLRRWKQFSFCVSTLNIGIPSVRNAAGFSPAVFRLVPPCSTNSNGVSRRCGATENHGLAFGEPYGLVLKKESPPDSHGLSFFLDTLW